LGFFIGDNMKDTQEKRIKMLEEDVAWMKRDINILTTLLEHIKPEVHWHYYYDLRTKSTDKQIDLNEFI